MLPSDEELMVKVKENGDTQAFETLVQRYKRPLINFVYRFVGDNDSAEDLSQDVFLRLWASADTYMPIAKFATFLYTIAKNLCLNVLSKSKNSPQAYSLNAVNSAGDTEDNSQLQCEPIDPSGTPEQKMMEMELERRIKEAVGKLSPEQRLVLILTEYHGFSYQEVSAIAQCPVGTVASRKNSAMKALRRYLAPLKE